MSHRAGSHPALGGWQDYMLGGTAKKLVDAAETQIRLARARTPLARANAAEGITKGGIFQPAATVAGAQLRGAFWMAVAARLLGNDTLINAAESLTGRAKSAVVWGSKLAQQTDPSGVLRAYAVSAAAIRNAAGARATTDANLRYVLAALGAADTGMIQTAQQVKRDQSVVGIVKGTAAATVQDLKKGANVALDLATGEKTVPGLVFSALWEKYRWYILGAGAVGVGGLLVLRKAVRR
jgi:hypothetical protein